MVLGAIVCPVDRAKKANDRLTELRHKYDLPKSFEIKWTKVSPAKYSFYLDVLDYFFDNDALEFRSVVASKKNLNHAAYGQTHDDWYYKMMFYLIRNVLPSGQKSYIYLDKKDTRGSIKVRKLHEVISTAAYDFRRDNIRRVQVVESHHVGLMQLADLLIGAVNYANRNLNTSSAKDMLVERIRKRAGVTLTRTTLLKETKFNVFHWTPRERPS